MQIKQSICARPTHFGSKDWLANCTVTPLQQNKIPTAHALTVAEINAIVNNMLMTTSFHPCICFPLSFSISWLMVSG